MALHVEAEDGMLQMPILEHLEELRSRILRALVSCASAYAICLAAAGPLWVWVQAPLTKAAAETGARIITVGITEEMLMVYVWSPIVASLFLAAPMVLYQVWAFVAPGLYPRERRWARPFLLTTAGLFGVGGAFAYYVVLPYSLVFLVGTKPELGFERFVSISSYFEMFVNVMLGVSIAFELPVAVFFLTLLRLTTPRFLLRNSRYAVLVIAILAAVATPSPNVFDMAMFFVPMVLLYFLGVFASYLLVLHRDDQPFPWREALIWLAAASAVALGARTAYRRYLIQ